jgi:hypothetical protein
MKKQLRAVKHHLRQELRFAKIVDQVKHMDPGRTRDKAIEEFWISVYNGSGPDYHMLEVRGRVFAEYLQLRDEVFERPWSNEPEDKLDLRFVMRISPVEGRKDRGMSHDASLRGHSLMCKGLFISPPDRCHAIKVYSLRIRTYSTSLDIWRPSDPWTRREDIYELVVYVHSSIAVQSLASRYTEPSADPDQMHS